jgi:hypothetical protein
MTALRAMPGRVWVAVLALVVTASLATAVVFGAGLSAWRATIGQFGHTSHAGLANPGGRIAPGVITVPGQRSATPARPSGSTPVRATGSTATPNRPPAVRHHAGAPLTVKTRTRTKTSTHGTTPVVATPKRNPVSRPTPPGPTPPPNPFNRIADELRRMVAGNGVRLVLPTGGIITLTANLRALPAAPDATADRDAVRHAHRAPHRHATKPHSLRQLRFAEHHAKHFLNRMLIHLRHELRRASRAAHCH